MTQSISFQTSNQTVGIDGESVKGLAVAIAIISLWAISLAVLLTIDRSEYAVWVLLLAFLWQTFLYTGLFITAHDAMHGAVFPANVRINNWIGSLTLILYGLFSYQEMLRKHWMHHKHPSSRLDPDYHDEKHDNLLLWYFQFMKRYWSWKRLIGLAAIYNFAKIVLHIDETNLTLFWMLPAITSSLQLFFFGTYLPHKEPEGGYTGPHRTRSTGFPLLLSFITCYHFGYHEEHHEYPNLPWWRLPQAQLKSDR